MIKALGAEVDVFKNDAFKMAQLGYYDKLVLSPGPGVPVDAGLVEDVIRHYAGLKPMLGVCLGEQAIAEVFGAELVNLPVVYHGMQSEVKVVCDDALFGGLPRCLEVGRYHSWVVNRDTMPDCLEVMAISSEGYVMALRHRQHPVYGIQFHPESVLTPMGKDIMRNFLDI